jgi:hypothetical protein
VMGGGKGEIGDEKEGDRPGILGEALGSGNHTELLSFDCYIRGKSSIYGILVQFEYFEAENLHRLTLLEQRYPITRQT